MMNMIPSELRFLPVYAVGGCVRDVMLGLVPKDIDLTTPLRPEEVIAKCNEQGMRVRPIGLKYGTVTVVLNAKESYEVTTFRIDHDCDGRHAEVEFTSNLIEDLARRDFTINAMAVDGDGNLHDPFGGTEDLNNRVIRCVGEPSERFDEDLLRILRSCRFAAKLNAKIEGRTYDAMILASERFYNEVGGLISIERIYEEFCKAFETEKPSIFLHLLHRLNIINSILPELCGADCLMQHPDHHPEGNVWNHTLEVVDRAPKTHRWHALLHDIGKMVTAEKVEGYNYYTFHGHEKDGADMIRPIGERLRFPNKLIKSVEMTTRYHMKPMFYSKDGHVPNARQIRRFQVEVGDYLDDVRILCDADAAGRDRGSMGALFEKVHIVEPILLGRHLIDAGVIPGPHMGKMLIAAFEHQIEDGETNVSALLEIALKSREN